jgi:hypothetical protein
MGREGNGGENKVKKHRERYLNERRKEEGSEDGDIRYGGFICTKRLARAVTLKPAPHHLPGSLIPNIPSLGFAANVSDRHGHRFTILATTGSCSCQGKNNGGWYLEIAIDSGLRSAKTRQWSIAMPERKSETLAEGSRAHRDATSEPLAQNYRNSPFSDDFSGIVLVPASLVYRISICT